jgi:hypothetical protein
LGNVKQSRPWLYYSILRVAIFVVIFVALLLMSVIPWIATTAAAILALCLSYIFLKGPRDAVALDIYARRHGSREEHDVDNEVENEILDRNEANRPTE